MKLVIVFLSFSISLSVFAMRDQGDEFTPGKYSLHGKLKCIVSSKKCLFFLYPKTTRQISIPVSPKSFERAILYNGMNIEALGKVDKAAKGRLVRFSEFSIVKVTPDYKILNVVYDKISSKK